MSGDLACREEPIDGKVAAMLPRPRYNHIAFNIAVIFRDNPRGKRCTVIPDGTGLYDDFGVPLGDIFSVLLP